MNLVTRRNKSTDKQNVLTKIGLQRTEVQSIFEQLQWNVVRDLYHLLQENNHQPFIN